MSSTSGNVGTSLYGATWLRLLQPELGYTKDNPAFFSSLFLLHHWEPLTVRTGI